MNGPRAGLGCFVLFSLLTNLYVIFMFNRLPSDHDSLGTSSGAMDTPSQWRRRGEEQDVIRRLRRRYDEAGTKKGKSSENLKELVESLQGQIEKMKREVHHSNVVRQRMNHHPDNDRPKDQRLRSRKKSPEEIADDMEEEEERIKRLKRLNIKEGLQKATKRKHTKHHTQKSPKDHVKENHNNDNKRHHNPEGYDMYDYKQQHKKDRRIYDHNDPSGTLIWERPDNWEAYDFYQTRNHFKCRDYAHDQDKPMPSMEDWNYMKDAYQKVVPGAKFDDKVSPTEGYTINNENGEAAPYYAAHSLDGRGRGLFASRDIKKGELVHDGRKSDFIFPSAMAWRRYVFSLPRNKACDVIDWSWTQKKKKRGPYQLFSAMNISILLNGGDKDTVNINPRSSLSSKMYALRDIRKGEELLHDYEIYDTVWHEVGLGSANDDYDDDDDVAYGRPIIV